MPYHSDMSTQIGQGAFGLHQVLHAIERLLQAEQNRQGPAQILGLFVPPCLVPIPAADRV